MDISVIIVNWNTKELLYNCIISIQKHTTGVSYEIVIVDNNSSDGTVEMVKRKFPECKLIESEDNLGFARGNNLGLLEASGKYIFFLNPDTSLVTNALNGMFRFLENNQEVGAVGCKLLNQDGSIQFVCARTYPSLFNQICFFFMLNRLFPKIKIFSTIEMGYWDHKESRVIDCLSGACIFARRNIIESLKGFDDNFFMYAEDVDLCYRIYKNGWKLYYLSSEEIYHLEGQSSNKVSNKYFAAIAQRESNKYYFLKHYGYVYAYIYQTIIFFGSLFRVLVILLSIIDIRRKSLIKNNRLYVLLKYLNMLLWSVGLKKI